MLPAAFGSSLTDVPSSVVDDCACVSGARWYDGATTSDLIIDCGATKHCMPIENVRLCATNFTKSTSPRYVRVANGQMLKVAGYADVALKVKTYVTHRRKSKQTVTSAMETMRLSNVLAVHGIKANLFSCEWAHKHDNIKTYLNDRRELVLPSGSCIPFKKTPKHYAIDAAFAADALTHDESHDIHCSLMHFSSHRLDLARSHGTGGLNLKGYTHDPKTCPACNANRRKYTVPKKSQSGREYTYFGQSVCSDVCGPLPESPNGYKYAVNFYDKATKHAAVYAIKDVTHAQIRIALETYCQDHNDWFRDGKSAPDEWVCDNNFQSNDIDNVCADLAVRRTYQIPHTKESHGAAERLWGILLRPVRCAIEHHGNDTVVEGMWPYLMKNACYIHNNLPSTALSPPRPPVEAATCGRIKADLSRLKGKVPLSDCWVHTESEADARDRNKVASPNVKAMYLCPDFNRSGDIVYIHELNRITTVFHITHLPHEFTSYGEKVTPQLHRDRTRKEASARIGSNSTSDATARPRPVFSTVREEYPAGDAVPVRIGRGHIGPQPPPVATHPSSATALMITTACGEVFLTDPSQSTGPVRIPTSYHDAINDPVYGKHWKDACDEEWHGKYVVNQAFHFCPTPNTNVMKSKWVFKVEYNDDGSIKRFKARIVGCGYSQQYGIDYKETFCSAMNADSCRCFLYECCESDYEIEEGDVVKAFSQASLDEDLYMYAPAGFEQLDMVLKLDKQLEGTKQAGNGWMRLNATTIEGLGFTRSMLDPNIYTKTTDGITIKIACYVDNLLFAYPRTEPRGKTMVDEFIAQYSKVINFQMRGKPSKFMGIEVQYDAAKGRVSLAQTKYIEEAYVKFCGSSSKTYPTPVATCGTETFMKLQSAAADEDTMHAKRAQMSGKPYLSLCGVLLWAQLTHPEVSYYVSHLCQQMSDPTPEGWAAAIGVLCYLYSARFLGLVYMRCGKRVLRVWTDASYGIPKAMAGYIIYLNGTPITWSSRKLKITPQSSAEAETAAACNACKAMTYIRNILATLGLTVDTPIEVVTDNEALRLSVRQPGVTQRTRHYESWMQYCRELQLRLVIDMIWTSTENMIADALTKALDKTKFIKFRSQMVTDVREGATSEARE